MIRLVGSRLLAARLITVPSTSQKTGDKSVYRKAATHPVQISFCRNVITMTTSNEVKHDTNGHTFYLQIQEEKDTSTTSVLLGEIAKLEYEWMNKGAINFYHTEVPTVYRGMGLAKLLAKAALDFAVEKDVKILLTCSYLAKYVNDNPLPEYVSRLIDNPADGP